MQEHLATLQSRSNTSLTVCTPTGRKNFEDQRNRDLKLRDWFVFSRERVKDLERGGEENDGLFV